MGYVYTIHCPEDEAELAAAEAWAFTGSEPQGRLVRAPWAVDITRAAYLRDCVHVEAAGHSLDELVADCLARRVAYEGFRLQFLRPPPKVAEHKDDTILRVANAITGRPDLHHPRVRLGVVAVSGAWAFGRIISTGGSHWLRGIDRPVHFSSALPQRFSRALVNLVAAPGDTLIDPCCGIGTPLIEALDAGVTAFGADTNPKMLRGLAENLRHLGLPLRLFRADARRLAGRFDAAVLDLPYGRNLPMDEQLYRELLGPLGRSARRVAIVAARDLDKLLDDLGYTILRHARVRKWQLVRHVYVLQGE
ncbi:hypothetical protein LLH23_06885 [bacterium]|nr:hypothetical protein [bacterium]